MGYISVKPPPKDRQEWTCYPDDAMWCEGLTEICFSRDALHVHMREFKLNTLDALDKMLRKVCIDRE